MKVRELKAILATADDEADVIVHRHTSFGSVSKVNAHDVFEAYAATKQPSGKVSIFYDASMMTTTE